MNHYTSNEFSIRDWLGVISLIVGVISLILSYYFYVSSIKEKKLSIIIDKDITPIIDTTKIQSKKFSVIDTNGKKINGDISAFKVKVINDGDLTIWKKDILTPLSIVFRDPGVISGAIEGERINFYKSIDVLDYFIVDSKRKEVVKPKVLIRKEKYSDFLKDDGVVFKENHLRTEFMIDFSVLESGDEINITVIFLGSQMRDSFGFSGAVEGVKKIELKSVP